MIEGKIGRDMAGTIPGRMRGTSRGEMLGRMRGTMVCQAKNVSADKCMSTPFDDVFEGTLG
jgi:hypothetical protein